MSLDEIENFGELNELAAAAGVAVALVDAAGNQAGSANNNSICEVLNPGKTFSAACGEYCGKAYSRVKAAGKAVDYECFAGLQCRATSFRKNGRELVAIAGRAFVKAENYRKATERAISGDWNTFRPTEFFGNILLTGSSTAIERLSDAVAALSEEAPEELLELGAIDEPKIQASGELPHPEPSEISRLIQKFQEQASSPRAQHVPAQPPATSDEDESRGEIADLRSLSGSLLKADYAEACGKFLDFICDKYGLDSLLWFEVRDDNFRQVLARGPISGKSVEIGIDVDHAALADAIAKQMPLVLRERERPGHSERRILNIFPLTVGGEIRSALGVEGEISGDARKRRIVRVAQSVASQLEILRLRDEVMQRDWLARAVRLFNESLKKMDADDFWLRVTQVSAELLGAERASLLVRNEKSNRLQAKAAIGARVDLAAEVNVGSRVSFPAMENGMPLIVADASKFSSQAPSDHQYRTGSFLTYPVAIGERNLAVLNFTDKADGGAFTGRDLELLQAIAPQIAMAIDRASLKDKAGEFEQLSVTDSLTGLVNRRYLQERLSEEIQRSRRHRFPLSFLMLDVDNFKSYNDTFGHLAGDAALRIVASILKDNLRGDDVAARYGGEEFAVLLPQTRIDEATVIAERIRTQIEATDFPHRRITASIGIASSSANMTLPDDLIWAADRALYEAKGNGRNKVQLYDDFGDPLAEKVH